MSSILQIFSQYFLYITKIVFCELFLRAVIERKCRNLQKSIPI
nr:MAG TPA: hypothetical protein [Caudoviricetes sp.]